MRTQAYMVEMVAGEIESYRATLSIHIFRSSAQKKCHFSKKNVFDYLSTSQF